MNWTDAFIKELIACPKIVIDPPKETSRAYINAGLKKTFMLASEDGLYTFSGFIMQNRYFAENFSVGLVLQTPGEHRGIVLVRCNGKHGGTKIHPHHADFHIHYATAERIVSGQKPEGHIAYCDKYASLEGALDYIVDLVNVLPGSKHMIAPRRKHQLDIFDNEI